MALAFGRGLAALVAKLLRFLSTLLGGLHFGAARAENSLGCGAAAAATSHRAGAEEKIAQRVVFSSMSGS